MDHAAPPGGRRMGHRRGAGGAADLRLSTLRLEQSGRVLTARVDSPPFNYLTVSMQRDFIRLVEAVEHDASVGAVVVTGARPGRFITHADITEVSRQSDGMREMSHGIARHLYRGARALARWAGTRLVAGSPVAGIVTLAGYHTMALRMMRSPAVWIAAVNGPCAGGGVELSVFFDIRVSADRDAGFAMPGLSVGLNTSMGGQRLAQLVGPSRAMEMMLEARFYGPQEALELGLVNRVVPAEDLQDTVRRMAERYARRPRQAVAMQKRIFNDAYALSSRAGFTREGIAALISISSPAARAATRRWARMREGTDGDSLFLTRPDPWAEGTALDLNDPARETTPP